MPADVPEGHDRVALEELRRVLERAEYTAERIEERLGTHELSSRPIDTAVHLPHSPRPTVPCGSAP
jgi:hypothetical protein